MDTPCPYPLSLGMRSPRFIMDLNRLRTMVEIGGFLGWSSWGGGGKMCWMHNANTSGDEMMVGKRRLYIHLPWDLTFTCLAIRGMDKDICELWDRWDKCFAFTLGGRGRGRVVGWAGFFMPAIQISRTTHILGGSIRACTKSKHWFEDQELVEWWHVNLGRSRVI